MFCKWKGFNSSSCQLKKHVWHAGEKPQLKKIYLILSIFPLFFVSQCDLGWGGESVRRRFVLLVSSQVTVFLAASWTDVCLRKRQPYSPYLQEGREGDSASRPDACPQGSPDPPQIGGIFLAKFSLSSGGTKNIFTHISLGLQIRCRFLYDWLQSFPSSLFVFARPPSINIRQSAYAKWISDPNTRNIFQLSLN